MQVQFMGGSLDRAVSTAKIEQGPVVISLPIAVSISLGISTFNGAVFEHANPDLLDKLIDQTDQAMYQSKANGRNRSTIFEPVD